MKIFIDPGHNYSGFDTGATGNGLREQDITFQVGKKLATLLKNAGFEVLMSRNKLTDNVGANFSTSLSQRATLANNARADYFISLHCDGSTSSSSKGSHICIYSKNSVAEGLANKINPRLLALGLDGRSTLISERPELAVLKKTTMPAILIEMGFITNPRDAEIQKNNQDGLANAIFMGVCDYLDVSYSKKEDAIQSPTEVTIKIDGETADIDFTNINSSIYVPIRKFCDLIGCGVEWDDATKEVRVSSSKKNITQPAISPTKYSIIGTTHVVEIDPMNIKHVETQRATNKTTQSNFVNSLYFMPQKVGGCFPQGHAASEGKILSNYATHGNPVATLIVHTDDSVEMAYVKDLNAVKNLWFAVSGYGVYPTITASQEGFIGQFSDVLRSTNRPIIGYRKSDNKIIIAVRAGSSAERARETAKNLGLDFAISLDAGGSTTLKVNGAYKFKGDGRQLWGGITWS